MTARQACGNCGSKEGCGCSTPNPYEQGVQVVWHDPTTYDVTRHGPAFLPKLASGQQAEVRTFLKRQAAYYDTGPKLVTPQALVQPLPWLLACQRALAHIHQTHHWQTQGQAAYADHLLFERLYNESLGFIDQVAERAVGTVGPAAVDAHQQIDWMHKLVKAVCGSEPHTSADQMVQASLAGEMVFLGVLAHLMQLMEADGQMSPGTHNLLEGAGDKHETFVYLLKQRLGGGQAVYSYDRG